jgi:hypothetical protein
VPPSREQQIAVVSPQVVQLEPGLRIALVSVELLAELPARPEPRIVAVLVEPPVLQVRPARSLLIEFASVECRMKIRLSLEQKERPIVFASEQKSAHALLQSPTSKS